MDSEAQNIRIRIAAASSLQDMADELARNLKALSDGALQIQSDPGSDAAVYVGAARDRRGIPDLEHARTFLEECRRRPPQGLVWVSSAAVHHPDPRHPGMVDENYPLSNRRANRIAAGWRDLEALARDSFDSGEPPASRVAVLRTAPVLAASLDDYFNCLLRAGAALVPPGYDPPMQFCSPADLARAILAALQNPRPGFRIYNLAPAGVVPLRTALRLSGVRRLPIPLVLQSPLRRVLATLGWSRPAEQLDYLRYNWTVSGERIRRELGFVPHCSSFAALVCRGVSQSRRSSGSVPAKISKTRPDSNPPIETEPRFDDFGMDREFISKLSRTIFRFLRDRYWRVEYRGLENIPSRGAALLVGLHRGLMPFDGVMMLHAVFEERGRIPRFLIHPGLIKPPFFCKAFTKLGGVIACQENSERILADGEILGVFPEGVRGAFAPYRDAYRLRKFDLNFVRLALRHHVPIVPFVTVGSAETYPILTNIRWRWWMRRMDWPCFPISTFPWLPLPLPTKWRTRILPPVETAGAMDDPKAIRRIGAQVRRQIGEALDSILERRTSWFR